VTATIKDLEIDETGNQSCQDMENQQNTLFN